MNKKMFVGVFLLSIGSLSQAQAGSLECASSNGKVQIEGFQKEGGAHPGVGMVIGSETWSYKGVEVGSRKQKYLSGDEITGRLGRVIDGTEKVVDDTHSGDKPMGTTKYTVRVVAPISATGQKSVKTTVLCTKTFANVPIP